MPEVATLMDLADRSNKLPLAANEPTVKNALLSRFDSKELFLSEPA